MPYCFAMRGLPRQHVGAGGVIKSQSAGQPRLIMADKAGNRFGDIGPFGEAVAPPMVIFRNGMELRQVKRNQPDQRIFGGRATPHVPHGAGRGPMLNGNLFQQIQCCHHENSI